jgi:hypothetical protein
MASHHPTRHHPTEESLARQPAAAWRSIGHRAAQPAQPADRPPPQGEVLLDLALATALFSLIVAALVAWAGA